MEWRFIPPFCASGSLQMAVDSWLLHQCLQGKHPPTLRFYTWEPVTVSLGHFQKRWPPHWSQLTWQGQPLSLVRRPSGGRGVLHDGDVTYSLVTSMAGYKRIDAYQALCQFLIQGWQRLGLTLQYGAASRAYHQETNCFRLATGADLVSLNGDKFIGSAQVWRRNIVLQHGSMAINPNLDLYAMVFDAVPGQPVGGTTAIQTLEFETIIQSLKQAAIDVFEIDLQTVPIADSEWKEISNYMDGTQV